MIVDYTDDVTGQFNAGYATITLLADWPEEDLWQTVDRRIWKEYIKALWKEVLWYPDNIKSVLYPKVQLYCRRLLLSISGWVAKKGQRKKN
jgi:hypothetical protein